MAQQKEISELKKRAYLAKQRLKMGYWQSFKQEKEQIIERVGERQNGQKIAYDLARAKILRDSNIVINNSSTAKDEKLYNQVCMILDENEDTLNPIGQLVDKDEYERLDDNGRQRYILELSNKFRELRERYYTERRGKMR